MESTFDYSPMKNLYQCISNIHNTIKKDKVKNDNNINNKENVPMPLKNYYCKKSPY